MRRYATKTWLWLAAVVLIGLAASFGPVLYKTALVGSGFTAEMLCNGVFVSRRAPESLLMEDLRGPGYEPLRLFSHDIDRAAKRVTASLFGLARQTAIYREGLGCTRLAGRSEAELRAEAKNLFQPLPPVSDALWPEGERVQLGTLPEGIDGIELDKAIDAIFSEPDPAHPRRTRALVVVYRGRIVAERYAPGFDAATPLIGWSMSKSATDALIGMRVMDGKLAVTENALMPEWRDSNDKRRAITLDEMLRMTSGLKFDETYDDDLSDVVQMMFVAPGAAAFAAAKPLSVPPGTRWSYSSGTTNIIAAILRETFSNEADYLRYPRARLFAPLFMRSAVLEPDTAGIFVASSFLYASARDWARLGLLFLQDGMWQGKRLLPEGWVAYSLTPTKLSRDGEFGAHLWTKLPETRDGGEPPFPDDAFYMLGHDQQTVAIVPSRDLVIVRLGLTREGGDWDNARDLAPILDAFPVRAP
jgi:CubicO group peptidase (beta-lactamase class C family)